MSTRSRTRPPADDDRPLVVRPLVQTDRLHNPDDIVVDEAAIAAGVEHGGSLEHRRVGRAKPR
ncbi:MAG: hypothetical protein K8W52_33275 [Deltaproteobacteria bacterium]|nr:hypothetical protein [Deltaproteobacteria bacterium]